MLLTIKKRLEGGCLILKVAGGGGEHDGQLYFKMIRLWIEPGTTRVILDLDGVSHVTSGALNEIAAACRHVASAGCQLVLACAREKVRRMFVLDELDKAVAVADSVEAALAGRRLSGRGQALPGPDGFGR